MESLAYLQLAQAYEAADGEGGEPLPMRRAAIGRESLEAAIGQGQISRRMAIGLVSVLTATGAFSFTQAARADEYAGGGYFYIFSDGEDESSTVATHYPAYPDPAESFRPVRPVLATPDTCAVLKYGDSGDSVRCLQESLRQAGYFTGPATGYFGKQTEWAVRAFQTNCGLVADGIAGPATLAALHRYGA